MVSAEVIVMWVSVYLLIAVGVVSLVRAIARHRRSRRMSERIEVLSKRAEVELARGARLTSHRLHAARFNDVDRGELRSGGTFSLGGYEGASTGSCSGSSSSSDSGGGCND